MRKRIILTIFILTIVLCTGSIFAMQASPQNNGYNFEVEYTGDIIEGEEKKATVILEGTDATPYTNVRVKFELVSGPATPKIIAYEDNGNSYNMIETVYWGPEEGFAVGNTFRNETPVTATYPKAGTYVTRLSLINKSEDDAVIASKEFTTTVLKAPAENTIDNNVINDNVNNVTEIPKTGISIWTYLVTILLAVALIYVISRIIKK